MKDDGVEKAWGPWRILFYRGTKLDEADIGQEPLRCTHDLGKYLRAMSAFIFESLNLYPNARPVAERQ